MKKTILVSLVIILFVTIGVTAFMFLNSSPFVVFADHGSLSESAKEDLLQRLNDNGIEYKIDKKGSVLIREKDVNRAVTCCS